MIKGFQRHAQHEKSSVSGFERKCKGKINNRFQKTSSKRSPHKAVSFHLHLKAVKQQTSSKPEFHHTQDKM
ncbi:MAG: hypothetical protein DRI57_25650 [Deltaproteobacteria bacterium]|nr:MAG: hypothetical protein DRI57_25650 [Deltaproteobacteria bacterium]